ncbi:MAG: hypothetical protein HYX78_01940 [Armatimonadetes bacterium]|nr:hypothetical protein [Armatimonadota bacterium]
MLDVIGLATAVSRLTGYNIGDVIGWLRKRQFSTAPMTVTTARLLETLTRPDDELTGCWYVSQWRYLWRSAPA